MKGRILNVLFALVLALSLGVVLAAPAAAATITVGPSGDYPTIQAAIDAASAGDTIQVAAGTYTEDLTVNTSNLTLKSASGATIQLVDGVGINIQGGASYFTLGGSSGHGFNILSGAGTTFNVQLENAPSNVTISYDTIDTSGSASMGISVGVAGATGLTISHNTFTAELNDGSIWGPKLVNVTVSSNTMTGPSASPAGGYAVEFAGVTGTSTISSNTISNYSMGVAIFNGEGTSGLTIGGNTIAGCTNGIRLGQYSPSTNGDMTTVTVTQNTLTTNTIGIRIGDGANVKASQFTITNNNISGSITYGLQNQHATEAVTAEDNWWGSANGPTHSANMFNIASQGDAVTDSVDYVPWLNAAYATGTSFAPVVKGTSKFSSIQAAIDAASPADILVAAAGTFTEDLAINTSDITLRSTSGAAIIQLTGDVKPGIDIQGGASGFTLGGSSGHGFTILGPAVAAGGSFPIQLTNAPSDVTISYNSINTTGPASIAISIGAAGATGLTIDHNTFTGDATGGGEGAINGPNVVDVTVTNNTFTGADLVSYGVQFSGVTGTSVISGNEISGYASAGGIVITNGAGLSGLTISSNNITGNNIGIYFAEEAQQGVPATVTSVTVENNTFTSNVKAIRFGAGAHQDASKVTVQYNNFIDSTTYGLQNEDDNTVTAENNWWGSASGPTHASNPFGIGDIVSNTVDFTPWLLAASTMATPTTYDRTLALQDGWTLVSVDREVTTGTNWVGTDNLTADTTVKIMAFKYDADPSSEDYGYTQVTLATQLTSVDAYYVKTNGGGSIGLIYSTAAPGVVTKNLYEGWNTISCAGETDAYTLLSQLRYAEIGTEEGVGLTSLVSQGDYNQFSISFYVTLVTPAEWLAIDPADDSSEITLSPYDGYWVYLNADKIFGVIPFTPAPG